MSVDSTVADSSETAMDFSRRDLEREEPVPDDEAGSPRVAGVATASAFTEHTSPDSSSNDTDVQLQISNDDEDQDQVDQASARVGVIRRADSADLAEERSKAADGITSSGAADVKTESDQDPSSSSVRRTVTACIRSPDSDGSFPPRIEVIVGPQFHAEFLASRATGMAQSIRRSSPPSARRPASDSPKSTRGGATTAPVVSSSTSPGPQSAAVNLRQPQQQQHQQQQHQQQQQQVVMGPPPPPPPPAAPIPAAKSSGSSLPRIRKSTASQHRDHEEPSSSIPEIEFDGNTVLCRVCGDKASGFHYGVHSCEGCKGFFRRSIQQKIQYRPCTKNQQCAIQRINRNRCQYCRLKKCISVGMSRDAVRFGRVPKREKAKILAAMQSNNARLAERALPAEFGDESQLMSAVVRAHMETCDFIREKVRNQMADAQRQPDYTVCPPTLSCPLNPTPAPSANGQQQLVQDFSERFVPAIRDVVEFAKRLPGFSLLCEDDKVTLLKPSVFEVLLVRLAAMFDSQSNTMLCLNGQLLRRDSLHNSSNARFLMDSMFEFADRLNSLGLNDHELGLFCAVVVIAADRPGLKNVELVERMQSKLRSVLGTVLNQAHPDRPGLFEELLHKIPDLRTLNTLHSEKLLAFKMTEQQQQQQQQQQQHPMHHSLAQYAHGHAPSSPWHDSYDEEGAKSPMGSVSSSESVCSAGEAMSDLPLLAAVAGSAAPLVAASRRRPRGPSHSENGSMSSDGEENDASIAMMMESPSRSCPYKGRKLDSPDDSGIESGVDRYEKLSTTSRSTNTSLCSSPRSSLEDKVKEVDDVSMGSIPAAGPSPRSTSNGASASVDDMPVLKRVLQAPPLFDTNLLMDEAYKPHKKFRALTLQRKGGEESVTPVPVPVVTSVRAASAAGNPPSSSPSRATTPQSSPSVLSAALSSPPGSSSSYSALCSALTSSPSTSSLTSTHSTLARSLMEGPKLMNSEHQRRADLIVANIMKGTGVGSMCASSPSSMSSSSSPSPTPSSSSSYSTQSYAGSPYSPQKTVLTSGPLYNGQSSSPSPSSWHPYQRPPVASSAQSISRIVYEPAHHAAPMASPAGSSPSHHRGSPLLAHSPRSTPQASSSVVELQVGIASDSQPQPLNLSLKSPSSSPARSTTPVTHAHYFPLHA